MMLEKIRNKSAEICVVGLGYIGLPVAAYFASAGFKAKGYDLNPKVVETIKAGGCPIGNEPGFDEVFEKALGNLEVSTKPCSADIYIICVQTPVRGGQPDTSFLEGAIKGVSEKLEPGNLVIVESTVPPGTVESQWKKYGRDDCKLAHCPERVMPGKLCKEFVDNSRIIGGYDNKAGELAKELYSHVVRGEIEILDLKTAELVKVMENTYRNTNIALANEFAILCDELGVNAFEAIRIANKHPRVNIHVPGCGVGGNCVPVSPVLLTHNFNGKHSVIKESLRLNEEMPSYLVKLVDSYLGEKGKVILMGYSYKPDSPDLKRTPGREILSGLKERYDVRVFDPLVEESDIKGMENFYEECKGADCLVLATAHSAFREMDLERVKKVMKRPLIIDGRGFFVPEKVRGLGFEYDGIGV